MFSDWTDKDRAQDCIALAIKLITKHFDTVDRVSIAACLTVAELVLRKESRRYAERAVFLSAKSDENIFEYESFPDWFRNEIDDYYTELCGRLNGHGDLKYFKIVTGTVSD